MSVADNQMDLLALDRGDDGVAIGERQRHRLFQNNVLAMFGREDRVRRMELMRRRDINDLDRRIGAQSADVIIDAGIEIAGERRPRDRMRIGRRTQRVTAVGRRCLHHHRAGHAEPGDTEADGRRIGGGKDHGCQAASPAAFLSRSTNTPSLCSSTL